jgi:hypothetical protein
MKFLKIAAVLVFLPVFVSAQKLDIKAMPYDTLLIHADSTGKNILDRKNCPVIYENVPVADYVYVARRGYEYRAKPIRGEKKPAFREMFLELSPVTFAAKDDFINASEATDKLLNYLEFYPMLADGEFYFSFYKAMEKRALKNKSLKFKNIMGDIVYKDDRNGVCAVTSVNFDAAGARQSPMAPAAAGDSGIKNTLNLYFFGSDGKLKYQMERNCRKYGSFTAAFDEKNKIMKITEDYVTLYLNNMQGDIHVKLEYSVSFPALKFNFEKFTYYTDVDGRVFKPVEYSVKSGVADVKNNK